MSGDVVGAVMLVCDVVPGGGCTSWRHRPAGRIWPAGPQVAPGALPSPLSARRWLAGNGSQYSEGEGDKIHQVTEADTV